LKEELESLIDLIKQSIAPSSAAPPPPSAPTPSTSRTTAPAPPASEKPKREWKSGDDCSARYTGDGKWYPARITSVAGSSEQPIYTVIFKGYDTPETISQKDLRPASNQFGNGTPSSSAPLLGGGEGKRKAGEPSAAELEKEKKKKKNEKKAETQKAKAEEQANRQKGWQSFAKKSAKKGVSIPGMAGEHDLFSSLAFHQTN